MRWKRVLIATALSLTLLGGSVSAAQREVSDQNASTLLEIYSRIVESHYSHPDQEAVLRGAIEGMLQVLNDPFSSYLTTAEYEQLEQAIEQEFAGLGSALQATKAGEIMITEIYSGSAAEEAGLQVGDRILAVDGKSVIGEPIDKVSAKIRGKAGTQVVLTIRRGTEASKQVAITRKTISLPTVLSKDSGNGVGYLRILSFASETSGEFHKAYQKIAATSPKGILLDLRGNGGGYVHSALTVADSFLAAGTMIVIHEGEQRIELQADEESFDLPLAVLVDQHTASASEILAGALQKNGRAVLIGAQTYGKGTMQELMPMPDGGVLKLSVDKWEFSDGTTNHLVGLTPDIRLTAPEIFLNAGMQYLFPGRKQTLTLYPSGGWGDLNGTKLLDMPTVLRVGQQQYLPLRYVVEALGSEVNWVQQTSSVEFQLEQRQVRVELGSGQLFLDGKRADLNGAVRLQGGVSYLSTAAFDLILGGGVRQSDTAITLHVD
ncbi:S41 family peptidase [Tumebacillus lipolyticus]|uniref:S41 family peptidase n=1 Tax=Tumebacillus lipolyticus TaxID=1280370 RepID=A0ABW4ZY86_9BACL